MGDEHSYLKRYAKFFQERANARGYDFHDPPSGNVPLPKVTFLETLRWWSWDRWKRMKKIRAERDRRQQDILQLRGPATHKDDHDSDAARGRISWDPPTG